ncbi:hypothetical protein M0R45_012757 [Rubus argutus]|uniref:MULE transposase domain-containing protein n=1 Tax=Rubus argutus TaxID=59490 RepID=A0AAW1XH55_RUBAR
MLVDVDGSPSGVPPSMGGLIFHCLVEQRCCIYHLGLAMRQTFPNLVSIPFASDEIVMKSVNNTPSFGTEWLNGLVDNLQF